MSSVLQVENINVYYGSIHAVKDVSFHVEPGEVVTLIGANGAGKSTTLNTVAGLLHSRPGHGPGAGGAAYFPAHDGTGESGHGRLLPQRRQERRY